MTTDQADLKESHEQMRAAWSLYARSCPDGEVIDAAGLCLANARQPWALMNAALLPAPEDSDADLAAHATAAIRYYQQEDRPWFLAVSQPWLGDGAEAMLAGLGLGRTGTAVGMVSDQLAPPRRALPDVETRRIDDEAGRLALADLNAAAYCVSPDWARAVTLSDSLWNPPLFGYNAYIDAIPVATALVLPQNGILYVGWVATAVAYRRRGLADLVMRRALELASRETGLSRTVLHATADGYPAYLKMGYRAVDTFVLFGMAS
jgi:ribosomal protein S18 acetylase RimI-like enzyme